MAIHTVFMKKTASPSEQIKRSTDVGYPYPVEYRFWQPEHLLNEARMLLEKCLDIKIKADQLWVESVREFIANEQDGYDEKLSETEIKDEVDNWPLSEINAQLDALLNKDPAAHFQTGYSLGGNLEQSIKSIVVHGQRMSENLDGAPAAPGGVAQGQAVLALYQFGHLIDQLKARKSFEEKAKSRRTTIRKNAQSLRKHRNEQRKPGMALDFFPRCEALGRIVSNTLADVSLRCAAAYEGLKRIYGVDASVMGTHVLPPPSNGSIEDFLTWVQQQQVFLAQFGSLDQGFTVLHEIPLNGTSDQQFSFRIDRSRFSRHSHCRLRGISMFIESPDKNAIFRSKLQIPRKALYFIGQAAKLTRESELVEHSMDQLDMPACLLGRVSSWNSMRAPEVAGAVSLFNASPIGVSGPNGDWSVSVEAIVPKSAKISSILLELIVVGRPVRE